MSEPLKRVVTHEILGHPTDFLIEEQRNGDTTTLKITTVLPGMIYDGRNLRTYRPPAYPWSSEDADLIDRRKFERAEIAKYFGITDAP